MFNIKEGSVMPYLIAFGGLMTIVLIVGFILAYPIMLLWNGCLVPAIPSIQEIGWLQAWGIQVLFSVLFKTTVSTKKED